MREKNLRELRERIQASFEKARGVEAPSVKKVSGDNGVAKTAQYAELLMKVAIRQLGR